MDRAALPEAHRPRITTRSRAGAVARTDRIVSIGSRTKVAWSPKITPTRRRCKPTIVERINKVFAKAQNQYDSAIAAPSPKVQIPVRPRTTLGREELAAVQTRFVECAKVFGAEIESDGWASCSDVPADALAACLDPMIVALATETTRSLGYSTRSVTR